MFQKNKKIRHAKSNFTTQMPIRHLDETVFFVDKVELGMPFGWRWWRVV